MEKHKRVCRITPAIMRERLMLTKPRRCLKRALCFDCKLQILCGEMVYDTSNKMFHTACGERFIVEHTPAKELPAVPIADDICSLVKLVDELNERFSVLEIQLSEIIDALTKPDSFAPPVSMNESTVMK